MEQSSDSMSESAHFGETLDKVNPSCRNEVMNKIAKHLNASHIGSSSNSIHSISDSQADNSQLDDTAKSHSVHMSRIWSNLRF